MRWLIILALALLVQGCKKDIHEAHGLVNEALMST